MIPFLIAVAVYLAGGRAAFWVMTWQDWPESVVWDCGRDEGTYHSHRYDGCREVRNIAKSRKRRVAAAYGWPLIAPLVIAFLVVTGICMGVHRAITCPISTPAERRERRRVHELRVDAALQAAEADHERAKAEQAKAVATAQDTGTDRPEPKSGPGIPPAQPPVEYHASYQDDDYEPIPEVR